MIFNMVGAAGKKPFIPQFTGKAKLVLLNGGKAGYMEFYTSGTLTWLDGKIPATVDLFCVGGGGGGAGCYYPGGTYYYGGGGGSGYTTTVLGAILPASIEVIIGAGGPGSGATPNISADENKGTDGGTTSIGTLCVAGGGKGGKSGSYPYGGNGGSGGSGGNKNGAAAAGGSNGSSASGYYAGTGQGTPTTDLLGRKHAGGGSGGGNTSYTNSAPGGASDFSDGRGKHASTYPGIESGGANSTGRGLGGGGYGGGGGGANSISSSNNGGAGGDGFAMIAWGDYSSAIVS